MQFYKHETMNACDLQIISDLIGMQAKVDTQF